MRRIKLSDRERALLSDIIGDVLSTGLEISRPGQKKRRRTMITQGVRAIEDTINRRSFRSSFARAGQAVPANKPAAADTSN